MVTQTLPVYIAGCIRGDINAGLHPVGTRTTLESLRARYRTPSGDAASRVTILKSVGILRQEGLMAVRQGVGMFFGPTVPSRPRDEETTRSQPMFPFVGFQIVGGPNILEEVQQSLASQQPCRLTAQVEVVITSLSLQEGLPDYLVLFGAQGVMLCEEGIPRPITLRVATADRKSEGLMVLATRDQLVETGWQMDFPALRVLVGVSPSDES